MRNDIKNIIIIFSIFFYLNSCSDNSNPITSVYTPIVIEGKILNKNSIHLNLHAAVQIDSTLHKMVETNIQNDGSFRLELPEPNQELLSTHQHLNELRNYKNYQL